MVRFLISYNARRGWLIFKTRLSYYFSFIKVSIKFNTDNSALEGSTELLTVLNLPSESNMVKSRVLFTSSHRPNTLCIQITNEQTKQDTLQFWQVNKVIFTTSCGHKIQSLFLIYLVTKRTIAHH